MALKRWLWAPALAALGLAAVLLPPSEPSNRSLLVAFGFFEREWLDERPDRYRTDLQMAQNVQQTRLREARLADSALAASRGATALRSADGAVTVVYEAPLGADSARTWLRAATAELALYPSVARRGLPIVVAIFSRKARTQVKSPGVLWWTTAELLSAAPSRGACVVVVNLLNSDRESVRSLVSRDASRQPVGRFLDVCALYNRFGLPGSVGRWFTSAPTESWIWGWGRAPLAIWMQQARRPIRPVDLRHDEATWQPWAGYVPWLEFGCVNGAPSLCTRALGLSGPQERRYFYSGGRSFTRDMLVAFLLASRTPAEFATFWSSPLKPADALPAAFGESAGTIAMSACRHWFVAERLGGTTSGASVLAAGLLWAAVALALGMVAGRRWRVEL